MDGRITAGAGETESSLYPAINHSGVNFYTRGRVQLTCVEIGQEKFVGGRDFNLDASCHVVHALQTAGSRLMRQIYKMNRKSFV